MHFIQGIVLVEVYLTNSHLINMSAHKVAEYHIHVLLPCYQVSG